MKSFFKANLYGVKLYWILVPLLLSIICIIIGSFLDLQISQVFVSQESPFGMFGEGLSMIPIFIMGTIASSMIGGGLFQSKKKGFKILGIVLLIIGIVIMAYETYKFTYNEYAFEEWFDETFPKGKVFAYLFGFIIQCPFAGFFFFFKKKDPVICLKVGLFIVLLIALQAALIHLIKIACYRPRYRFLAGYSFDDGEKVYAPVERIQYYRGWYEGWKWFDPSIYKDKSNPILYVADKDYVCSFPSGHTGAAMVALTLPLLLVPFGIKEEKKKIILPIASFIGLGYLIIVGIARIRFGAHFCSDVAFAVFLVSLLMIGIYFLIKKLPIRFEKEADLS